MRQKRIFIVLIALVFMVGCANVNVEKKASYITTAYQTLSTAATVYETGLKALADLYGKGIINDEDKAKALKYGNQFWTVYHTSVNALSIYKQYETPDNQNRLDKALDALTEALSTFNEFIYPLLEKGLEK